MAETKPGNDAQFEIIEEKITNSLGETVIKRYARGKFLGKGGFAKCYECTNLDTKKVTAAKIIPKSTLQKSRQRAKLLSEIKIHRSLQHPNIVQFEHVFEDSMNVYILLELCNNQSLNDLIKRRKRLAESETRCVAWQVLQALKYLHSQNIIYQGVKLSNILLDDTMTCKLTDFGSAIQLNTNEELGFEIDNTAVIIPPEVLEGRGYSFPVDLWSFGLLLTLLSTGTHPFEAPDIKTMYQSIREKSLVFYLESGLSPELTDLAKKLLNVKPQERPTMEQVGTHPFFQIGVGISTHLPLSYAGEPAQEDQETYQDHNPSNK